MSRQDAERRGRRAETLCAALLTLSGWRVVARRWRAGRGSGAGEVDIIARKGQTVAFVEVKMRTTAATALESVGPAQRQRIAAGAAAFVAAHPDLAGLTMRFDVMTVAASGPFGLGWPRHHKDAWRL